MSKRVRAIIITGNGTNCEVEMQHACRLAGADVADIVHISSLLYGEVRLDDYDFLNLPGGFLDGDDLGAARAAANRILHSRVVGSGEPLHEQFLRFIATGKLILGVCNGFQLLVKLGFLPFGGGDCRQSVTLTNNDSGVFEDRWVHLQINPTSPCVFTKGLTELYLPVRHGEGKLVARDAATLAALEENELVVLRYGKMDLKAVDKSASEATAAEAASASKLIAITPTMEYPHNPNGSLHAIAGLCNPTGRLFGLMPHPEAYLHFTNHPRWTREQLPEEGMGLVIFRNAVEFIRSGGC